MYYTCRDNRTIVTACTPGFFDPTILGCSGVTTTTAATTTMSPGITTPRGPVPPTSPRDNGKVQSVFMPFKTVVFMLNYRVTGFSDPPTGCLVCFIAGTT